LKHSDDTHSPHEERQQQEEEEMKRPKVAVKTQEWVVTIVHLAFWAQIGVIIRATLGKFFVMGCGGGQWGPCLAGSLL